MLTKTQNVISETAQPDNFLSYHSLDSTWLIDCGYVICDCRFKVYWKCAKQPGRLGVFCVKILIGYALFVSCLDYKIY